MINISKPKIIKILILGASGMIGNTIFRRLLNDNFLEVYGTVRNKNSSILNSFTNNMMESYNSNQILLPIIFSNCVLIS